MHVHERMKIEMLVRRYSSDRESLRIAVDHVAGLVESRGLVPVIGKELFTLTIDEALTNAMEHGNGWNGRKCVFIRITVEGGALVVDIRDEGGGFAPGETGRGGALSPRGYGLRLIRAFCAPEWEGCGNRVRLRFMLPNGCGAEIKPSADGLPYMDTESRDGVPEKKMDF